MYERENLGQGPRNIFRNSNAAESEDRKGSAVQYPDRHWKKYHTERTAK